MPQGRDDEERLTADIIELARLYGRYGYRKIAALLRDAGWLVNDKRVERIWRREVSVFKCFVRVLRFSRREALARFLFEIRRLFAGAAIGAV
jgi:transposase InsO family protein